MELYKTHILQVFKANFPFEILTTPLGEAIKMPAKEAFILSNMTGAAYFDNPVFPFTSNGLTKLFYNAFDYNFVTGLFENHSLRYTPYLLSKAKPYLFDTAFKYVVPMEYDSDIALTEKLESFFDNLIQPTDYLIFRIETSKKGNGLEPFMEYLAASFFKRKGYIVENQIPLAHAVGSPDFGGYNLAETFNALSKFGLLKNGFHIIELAMLRLFKNGHSIHPRKENNLIIGEAKTSTRLMTKQLEKYLNTNLFDWGFEIHPFKEKAAKNTFGLLTLNSNFEIQFTPPIEKYRGVLDYNKADYGRWLANYMKFYLIANLANDEFNEYFRKEKLRPIGSKEDVVNFITQKTTLEILNHLHQLQII